MSEFKIQTFSLPAASLGGENPLAPLHPLGSANMALNISRDIPEEDRRYIGVNTDPQCLPYCNQDEYDRILKPRGFKAVVLENEYLRAVFMPELGGRLWSLYHKQAAMELLEANTIFQPANLAIRNAWFSGGVEWNIGTIGHTPLTCSPMFTARVDSGRGFPILRMYEYDRIRNVPYQIDAFLPPKSPVLFVRVRIINPHDKEIPMYWWSNIAVPEEKGKRVIVPADTSINFGYENIMRMIPVPSFNGKDYTYTTDMPQAGDYFFRIPKDDRRWITALDAKGSGLIQTSTSRLKGRKLFMWGTGYGSKRWQALLSQSGKAYLEIQAGLGQTQAEYVPMPPHADWSWLEAYGLMSAEPQIIHGKDWNAAKGHVAEKLQALISQQQLEIEYDNSFGFADRAPDEMIFIGSGWGAIENVARRKNNAPPISPASMPFKDNSITEKESFWLELLNHGTLPVTDPLEKPASYMVEGNWYQLLSDAVKCKAKNNWAAWYHLGVMHYHHKHFAQAQAAWRRSLTLAQSPWAYRDLAVTALDDDDIDSAIELYSKAFSLCNSLRQLASEYFAVLIKAGDGAKVIELIESLDLDIRQHGRMRYLESYAAFICGDFDRAIQILEDRQLIVPDLREGEFALGELWLAIHAKKTAKRENIEITPDFRERIEKEHPIPQHLDWRMGEVPHDLQLI